MVLSKIQKNNYSEFENELLIKQGRELNNEIIGFSKVSNYTLNKTKLNHNISISNENVVSNVTTQVMNYTSDGNIVVNETITTNQTISNMTNANLTNSTTESKSIWSDIGNNIHQGIKPTLFEPTSSNPNAAHILRGKTSEEEKTQDLIFYSIILISVLILILAAYFIYKFYYKYDIENSTDEEPYELFQDKYN